MDHSKQKITTFLMFNGKAEEAMNYYVSVFDQAEILSIQQRIPLVKSLPGLQISTVFHGN